MPQVDIQDLVGAYAASVGDGAPAYERIKRAIRSRIEVGEWQEGDQLPSESQLVAALGLSRMTINRALRELAADGVIFRNMGVGSFVASVKATSPLFDVMNIAEEVQGRGHRHSTRVVLLEREANPVARHLSEDFSGEYVFHSVIVHYEDDVPIQLEDRIVGPLLAPDYLDQDFARITPNDYLSRVAPMTRGEHIVEAVLPTVEESDLLELGPMEPCLQIRRRTWSAGGLVSIARLVQPGSRSRLEGSFGRDRPTRVVRG
ncbi:MULTISPECIES: histidine utilization repressor [unclassified Microbacterium]|uniref:histidine utilization repressor n=1 Tax=unclassified Microbacterium TaxID=2609290 RepID=UPI001AC3913E|nr:histidine utilization repressor [Microbacterium sp.]MBN9158501.1 histidine utilization repressor [Microbacterium sp.]